MTFTRFFPRLRFDLHRFACDREGVSAIEFALVLPFMLLIYIGSVELAEGLAIQFKVTETARTVTDLTSQQAAIDSTQMSGILNAAVQVVSPYPAGSMIMTVSEVTTNGAGQGTITWSCSLNGTAHPIGTSVTLPAALQTANISLIWGEVTYPYTPQLGYVITGTIDIYENAYFYPRLVKSISPPPSPPPC
jgi:Flp pilus assembly protein TadG